MSSAQAEVFATPEILIHILRRVHSEHIGSKTYRKSDLLRLWQARRVSKLWYGCVLETFAQKHAKWTTVILELGQFETKIDSNDETDPRSIPDTNSDVCWEIDDSHSESELEYIYTDKVTGRVTVEYEFDKWATKSGSPKTRAIFRPKEGVLPYDADLCRQRIKKLAQNKSVYPHSGVIIWNIAHDLRLPQLCLVDEDGSIGFDWLAMLRDFFCLEREVRRLKTRKFHRCQFFGTTAFRPVYQIDELSETDLDYHGMSETDNERRTYVRRLHVIRSNKVSRKRSGQKYVKQMLGAQRRGVQLDRPGPGMNGDEAWKLDEKASRRSLRHIHRAMDPALRNIEADDDIHPEERCKEFRCHWRCEDWPDSESSERKWGNPEFKVEGWPPQRDIRASDGVRTRYEYEANDELSAEKMLEQLERMGRLDTDPSNDIANLFLEHWRWSEREQRNARLRDMILPWYIPGGDGWEAEWQRAVNLVGNKPGKTA